MSNYPFETFPLTKRVGIVNPASNLDARYGPWLTYNDALTAFSSVVREVGLTVAVSGIDGIVEYWYKNGITDNDLVLKSSDVTEADILPTVTNYLSTNSIVLCSIDVKGSLLSASTNISNIFAPINLYQSLTGNWQSTYSTVQNTSANWNSTYNTVSTLSALWEESAEIIPTVTNYLSTNNVLISALTVFESISSSQTIYDTAGNSQQWNLTHNTAITSVNNFTGKDITLNNYIYTTTNTNLSSNRKYAFDTLSTILTATLPQNPNYGDEIELFDVRGVWSTNSLVVVSNNYIEQRLEPLNCNVRFGLIKLIYTNDNIGWRIIPYPRHNVQPILAPNVSIQTDILSGYTPLTVNLTGVNNLGEDIAPVSTWIWNLTGGNTPQFTTQNVTYTYQTSGTYVVNLTASNSVGTDTDSIAISAIAGSPWSSVLNSSYGSNIVAAYDFRDYNGSNAVVSKIGPNLDTSNVTQVTDGLSFTKGNTSWAFANSTVACSYPFTMMYVASTNNTIGTPADENVLINCSTARFGVNMMVFTRPYQSLMPYNGQDNQETGYLPNGAEWYFYAVSFLNNGTVRYATRKVSGNLNGLVDGNNGTTFNGYPGVAAGFGQQSLYGTTGTYRLALFINQAFSTEADMDYLFNTVVTGPAADITLQ